MDLNTYIGPFIVIKSTIPRVHKQYKCSNENCTNSIKNQLIKEGNFCSLCGFVIKPIDVTEQVSFDIHQYCEDKFGDVDLFSSAQGGGEHEVVVANCADQGGYHMKQHSEYFNILKQGNGNLMEDLARPDWKKLIEALTNDGVMFELGWGVVQWWW